MLGFFFKKCTISAKSEVPRTLGSNAASFVENDFNIQYSDVRRLFNHSQFQLCATSIQPHYNILHLVLQNKRHNQTLQP